MHLARSFRDIPAGGPTVCCIGAFDGMHLGHQHLIGSAVQEARMHDMRTVVVTFFPHPRAVLGRVEERYLTLPEEKARCTASLGVDVLLVHEFTLETIHTRAEDFMHMMTHAFDMRSLWAGPDFAFGYRREGTVAWLQSAAAVHGFAMNVAEPFLLDGRPVSSSRIRAALGQGDMSEAARCLGRPYSVGGRVGHTPCEVHLDERQWLPAVGEYVVRIGDECNHLTIQGPGRPGQLRAPAPSPEHEPITVVFV